MATPIPVVARLPPTEEEKKSCIDLMLSNDFPLLLCLSSSLILTVSSLVGLILHILYSMENDNFIFLSIGLLGFFYVLTVGLFTLLLGTASLENTAVFIFYIIHYLTKKFLLFFVSLK